MVAVETGNIGGGGGAGGFREVKNPITPYTASPLDGYPTAPNRVTVTATSFPITVGAGGAGGPAPGGNSGSSWSKFNIFNNNICWWWRRCWNIQMLL